MEANRETPSSLGSAEPATSTRRSWWMLLITLVLCLPPLVIDVGQRVSTHTMENVALVTSQETWLRWYEGESDAWLVTSNDTLPRVEKPPMLTWLNFLAWSGLAPQTSTPFQLTYRARLVSVVLGLVMLASIFWMGHSLGGVRLAIVATLVAGSMFFLQRQARTASYDIHFVAWATLAVAGALWAIKSSELAAGRSRQVLGWSVCGIAMGCSVMSKNPLPFIIVLLPVFGAIALLATRRAATRSAGAASSRPWMAAAVGVTGATLLALAPSLPWYWHVKHAFPEASATLQNEFRQPRSHPQVWYYYLGLFGLVVPWTPLVIGGLIQPWLPKNRISRRGLLVAWLWFVLIFLFFSLWAAKQQRYILPIVPAAALLCAQVVMEHDACARRGQRDRVAFAMWNIIAWLLIVASLVVTGFIGMQHRFVAEPVVENTGWPAAIAIGIGLLAVGGIALWHASRWQMWRCAIATAVWTLSLTTIFWKIELGEPNRTREVETLAIEAERIRATVGESPLRSLRITIADVQKYKLNEEFRFYYGRLIRRISPDELAAYASSSATPVYVIAKPQPPYEDVLRAAGYRLVDTHVVTDDKDVQTLWVHDGTR